MDCPPQNSRGRHRTFSGVDGLHKERIDIDDDVIQLRNVHRYRGEGVPDDSAEGGEERTLIEGVHTGQHLDGLLLRIALKVETDGIDGSGALSHLVIIESGDEDDSNVEAMGPGVITRFVDSQKESEEGGIQFVSESVGIVQYLHLRQAGDRILRCRCIPSSFW